MKIVIIAEKPSVAREIASIVGATKKEDGFIVGNNYLVTWAFGHLIQLAMPEQYGAIGFNRANLPIIPKYFELIPRQIKADKGYKVDAGALKQLKVIEKLFNQCDKIIVATDAGREGELIFRYIYEYLKCNKPFDRLWISSLTEKAIRQGLENLKAGKDYDNLYDAAKTRSQADWLVGINATQALSIAAGRGVYSLGRVQTPTLAMICSRYLENMNFKSVPYWQHQLNVSHSNKQLKAVSIEKYETQSEVETIKEQLSQSTQTVVSEVESKVVTQEPPLLYDLTALQKEANTKHGFSADKTLSIAQKLYEAKLITYPRTGSRYLSDDVYDTISDLVNFHVDEEFILECLDYNRHSVDDKKVTDHHAIIVTENALKENLSEDENTIYTMIFNRMLEAFSQKSITEQVKVSFDVNGLLFLVKGSVIKELGWKKVLGIPNEEKDEYGQELLNLQKDDVWNIDSIELLEKQTKPKPLHTEASLLSAMETAGKDLEHDAQRQAMKTSGLGTPATRASIIETLFARDYIKREKKSLVPTPKGLTVYEVVKDKQIADVELTGMWEDAFMKIESGSVDANNFKKSIEVYATQITEQLLGSEIEQETQQTLDCPKCKEQSVRIYPKVAKCMNEECGLTIFKSICGKNLSDTQVIDLLLKGKTGVIKGMVGKSGKPFDASLSLDEEYKIKFVFPTKKKK